MNKLLITTIISALSLLCSQALARDTSHMYPLEDALSTPKAKEKISGDIKLYFGSQRPANIARSLGSFTSNKKTNAFGKTDKDACEWAFLSAILALQSRAEREGGNAVIIHSDYLKNTVMSDTEYECGAGNIMAGVTLVGEVVKLKK